MVDVPCLDHLWDGQKGFPDVGQVRCFHEETSFLGHITFQIGILSPTTRIKTLLNGGTGLPNLGPIQS